MPVIDRKTGGVDPLVLVAFVGGGLDPMATLAEQLQITVVVGSTSGGTTKQRDDVIEFFTQLDDPPLQAIGTKRPETTDPLDGCPVNRAP